MTHNHSTTPTGEGTGSTEPELAQQRLQREAAKVFELWKTRKWQESSIRPIDSACLYRHKSLILDLAVDGQAIDSGIINNIILSIIYMFTFRSNTK